MKSLEIAPTPENIEYLAQYPGKLEIRFSLNGWERQIIADRIRILPGRDTLGFTRYVNGKYEGELREDIGNLTDNLHVTFMFS